MEKEPIIEKPKQYWETIRELEMKMFPEFKQEDIYAPEDDDNFYFAPSWHFKSGLITEADVNTFISDNSKTLLSIGSGAAYLEKLLTKLGINKENITLSDINPTVLPPDFKSTTIDINKEWTELKEDKYDLIIFPESFLAVAKYEDGLIIDDKILRKRQRDGLYHIILQSMDHLKPNGQMRINGHKLEESTIDLVILRLKSEGRKIKITNTGQLIVVKNETIA